MTIQRPRPSRLVKLGFKVPMWLYQLHLGFVFAGRIFAVVHHGRKSGKRYLSGLEILTRHDGELFSFSAWGRRADWYRNIEAGGVDELWDGRQRYHDVGFRTVDPDEAFDILARYEREHASAAKQTLPRTLPGYDFSQAMRRQLAETGVLVAFKPSAQ